jgi:hypothetical protein
MQILMKCGLCNLVTKEKTNTGACPRCGWDELEIPKYTLESVQAAVTSSFNGTVQEKLKANEFLRNYLSGFGK